MGKDDHQASAGTGPDPRRLRYQPLVDLRNGAVAGLEACAAALERAAPSAAAAGSPANSPADSSADAPSCAPAAPLAAIEALLRRSCEDRRRWHGGAHDGLDGADIQIAINVDATQLFEPQFGRMVAAVLDDHGIAAAALTLELTETTLMHDPAGCDAALAWFKNLGVSLTLDDFGRGQSCLGNLQRFPFDAIKIDGALMRDIAGDHDDHGDAALVKAIIAMAHNLGIRVVAAGVATEAQCDFLRRNMCDLIQGDFFAPPLTAEETGALLRADRRLPPRLLRAQKKRRTLLLVDDERNILSALKRLLRGEGYDIVSAASGDEGLEQLALHPVDVILSDQRMPGLSGADFLRKARILRPETIRIMLSGYTELQSVTDAVNEGAIYKFLTKPWDDEQLRAHLADAFRLKEIADDNQRLNLEVRTANHELASANRRMEQLLHQMQRQIHRDEISLHIAREILQHVPLPVIGLDDGGMIAFINGAAASLFRRAGALLGGEADRLLPELFPAPAGASHLAEIDGRRYAVSRYPMGGDSASRGSLITLSPHQETP